MPRDAATSPDDRIGHFLCQGGCLSEAQLDEALAEQARLADGGAAPPVGEICAQRGWCTTGDVAAAVRQQQEAVFRDTTLGHLLVAAGHLSLEQLDEALAAQAELRAPLGELLIASGACAPDQILAAVSLQARRRNAAIRHLTASAFSTFNVTEIVVNQELDAIRREEGACPCDECRANALALALNSLPPRYVSDQRLLRLYVERFRAESLDVIRQRIRVAVQRVQDRPKGQRHEHFASRRAEAAAVCPVAARRIERHVHLSADDVRALFGPDAQLTPWQPRSQPAFFAARETVDLVGPQGTIERVRVVGPAAEATRAEVTGPDLFALGLQAPPAHHDVSLRGPAGTLTRAAALVLIADHLHAPPDEARRLGLAEGRPTRVRVHAPRPRVYESVPVVVTPGASLELHLPAHEAAPGRLPAELLLDPPTS